MVLRYSHLVIKRLRKCASAMLLACLFPASAMAYDPITGEDFNVEYFEGE